MTELKITQKEFAPNAISFNYEELKAELMEKAKVYESLVYTEETMADAKADKANLNKLKKALNDERIKREKEWMIPFNAFKSQINDIISIIDKPVQIIDKQVTAYEDGLKKKKSDEIRKIWSTKEHPTWLELGRLWSEKWLNKTVTLKSIEAEIDDRLQGIAKDMETLTGLKDFSFEAQEEYVRTLDLGRAIAEGQRLADIQKRKEEAKKTAESQKPEVVPEKTAESQKPEVVPEKTEQPENPVVQEEASWIEFKAYLTRTQALMLRDFFRTNNIEFGKI